MKILFVHLGRENIGIEYLSSVLKASGHETHLAMDTGLFGRNDNIFNIPRLERLFSLSRSVTDKFQRIAPDIVCFSAYTSTLQWCFGMAETFKRIRDVPIVIGGVHITLAPESALFGKAIDYGIRGEAESVISAFADCIAAGRSPDHLAGLIYRKNGTTATNPPAPLVRELDAIPFPDKQLVEHAVSIKDDYMTVASRGCPNACSYCCEHAFRGSYPDEGYHRVRSVDNLMEELCVMKTRYRFSEVFFSSPIFPGDKVWVEKFSKRYRKEIGVPFWCFAHVNNIDRDYARLMKEAGCRMLEFGVQTVNETLRRETLGRLETNERITRAFRDCDAEGQWYDIGHIINLPGETESDYGDAVRFYRGFKKIHRIKVFNLTLFPGTVLLEKAFRDGLIDEATHESIQRGKTGDYFHFAGVKSALPAWKVKAYGHLIRLLPILPRKWTSLLARPGSLRLTALIPTMAVRLLELAYLIRIRDLRLAVFWKVYCRNSLLLAAGKRSA
jgi:anaerobic magnesium-protoporphyrin IX monomethyl ester cyclase